MAEVLGALSPSLPVAVVVVQHFDNDLVGDLCDWLSVRSGWPVSIAQQGDIPKPGHVYLANEMGHLLLNHNGFAYREKSEPSHSASIDQFLTSLCPFASQVRAAVLLSGMGKDGAEGLLNLRQAGCYTIAQDLESSVVEGMPKAASELGAVREVLPLKEIGPHLSSRFESILPRGG